MIAAPLPPFSKKKSTSREVFSFNFKHQLVIGGQAGVTYLLSFLAVTDGGTAGSPQTLYAEALCPVF